MALSLPTPVRVVAGLVGSTLDHLRNLPQELPALGVELAGQAFRIGLRVRQEVAALAVRGDDLLGQLGRPAEDKPSWATFDEDTAPAAGGRDAAPPPPPPAAPPRPARSPRVDPISEPGSAATSRPAHSRSNRPAGPGATAGAAAAKSKARQATRAQGPSQAHPRVATRAQGPSQAHADVATSDVPPSIPSPATMSETSPVTTETSPVTTTDASPATTAQTVGDPLDQSTVDLRDLLAGLDAEAVAALLAREESGQARAAYLTLLGNRLTTLRAGAGS